MTPTEHSGGRHVVLAVRETLPSPAARRRDRLRERLCELDADGLIDDFEVSDSPKRIRCERAVHREARDRYNEHSQWARDHGVCLRPFFDVRECYATDTGEKGDWIVLPAITVTIYEDGDLAAVYPHADGDDYRSVADGLTALAETATSGSVDDTASAPVTSSTP